MKTILHPRYYGLLQLIVLGVLSTASITGYLMMQPGLSSPAQAATCTPDANLVNPCRPWYGAAVGKYPQVSSNSRAQLEYHEQRIGRQVDIVHTYHPVGSNTLSTNDVYFANRANTMLFTNWKPAASWASAGGGNGTVNANIDTMARSIKALGSKKIFLTVHHEPENDVSGGASGCGAISYKGNAGTPAEYRAMWRNVYNRFNNLGVTNVVWVVDFMNYRPWDCMIDDLYPGNDIVDWVMFNGYGAGSTPNYSTNVSHFYNLLTNTSDASHNYLSKTWGIVEWNIRNATTAQEYSYYDQAKASLEANQFPRLKAYMVFDNVGPEGNENRIAYLDNGTYDATKQDHFKAYANSPVFTGGNSTPTPPPVVADTTAPTASITSPDNNATVSGNVTINVSASDNKSVAKVMFTIDGTEIKTDMSAPYSATWDTRQVENGSHAVRAKVYDTAGNTKTPQKYVTVRNSVATPVAPAIKSFTASPSSVSVGNKTTLKWSTSNAVSCSVSPNGPQGTVASTWTTPTYTSAGTKTYTLSCKNSADKLVSAKLAVTVKAATVPPAKPVFSADKTTIAPGANLLLTWSSTGATGCLLNPGNVTATGGAGSKLVSNVQQTTTFTLSCSNNAGNAAANPVTVTVESANQQSTLPSIVRFVADPPSLNGPGTTILQWSTANVASNGCNLAPSPLSSTTASGQWTTPQLSKSASFTLTCKDASGKSVSKSLAVKVAGKSAPAAPLASSSDTPATSDPMITSLDGQSVVNAQAQDTVTQGQLVTLDPSNVLDAKKIEKIVKLEYYDGEVLIQTVESPPYALATADLKPGIYTLTERVYYQGGSQSERTQNITIEAKPVSIWKTLLVRTALFIGGSAVGLGAIGGGLFLGRRWWLPGLRRRWPWLDQFLRLHSRIGVTGGDAAVPGPFNNDWPFGPQ